MHVQLGGQQRELRYPWKTIRRLHAEAGINLLKMEETDFTDPAKMSAIIWAGLLWEAPALTVEQVDEWITLGSLKTLAEAVADAMRSALQGDPPPNP